MVRVVYIYGLLDPRDGCLRYIGQSVSPKSRLLGHIEDAYKIRTHKASWIRGLLELGKKPLLEILETVTQIEANDAERFWIASVKAAGADLTNATPGGDGVILAPAVKARIVAMLSGYHRGRPKSAEQRQKMRASCLATWSDPELRERHRLINKGRKPSEETRARLSAAQRKRFSDPKERERAGLRSALRKGQRATPAVLAALVKARASRSRHALIDRTVRAFAKLVMKKWVEREFAK